MRVSLFTLAVAGVAVAAPLHKNAKANNNLAAVAAKTVTVTVTVTADCSAQTSTDDAATSSKDAVSTTETTVEAIVTAAPTKTTVNNTPSGVISVSGAKGTLEPSSVAESQAFDDTATRAVKGAQIKDSNGKCLTVDITKGDFRENLIPVEVLDCDGSAGQQWDFVTAGKHNNAKDSALIVSTLMNGCLNFDDRRAAGDQVIMFSCGGRADGQGQTTNSQLFPFTANTDLTKPYVLAPENGNNKVCLVTGANGRLGNEACDATKPSATEQFTVVVGGNAAGSAGSAATTTAAAAAATTTTAVKATTTPPPTKTTVNNTPSGVISVSGAKGTLEPSSVAESQAFDNTATRAVKGAQIKDSNGKCLTVDITKGDFRENLIPVEVLDCDGSEGQKWDFVTAGKHNNAKNSALIVSTLMNGCLNFDDRRAAGDQVIMFSCGGRADGQGQTTNSQLFPFTSTTDLTKPYVLAPENANNKVCLITGANGRLGNEACDATKPSATEQFTVVV